MPSFFKKKKSKKEKTNIAQSLLPSAVFAAVPSSSPPKQAPVSSSSSPTNLHRPISLPVISTGTQADFSPKPPLRAGQSLLDYGSSIPQDVPETDQGYSTVHDAIRQGQSSRKEQRRGQNANLRPLPAIPPGDEEHVPVSVHYSAVGLGRTRSDSSLTNLTPNGSSSESGSEVWIEEQKDDAIHVRNEEEEEVCAKVSPLSPVYATVVRGGKKNWQSSGRKNEPTVSFEKGLEVVSRKKDKPEKPTAQERLPVNEVVATCEVETELEGVPGSSKKDKTVKLSTVPSTFFELSDSDKSLSDESLLEDFFPDGGGRTPDPSSPILCSASFPTHRPPPSPSPGNSRSSHKSASKERTLSLEHTHFSSSREKKKSSRHRSKEDSVTPSTPLAPKLKDLPVYNLSQSFSDRFVLSRTDPDGRVEYFTATPILSPTPSVPLSTHPVSPLQASDFTRSQGTPGATSTPTKAAHQSPFFVQAQIPGLPQSPIPVLPQNMAPVSTTPAPLHFPFLSQSPVPPQTGISRSVLHHDTTSLNRSLSASQPSLSIPYIGGLTEIDQVLSDHEASISVGKRKTHQISVHDPHHTLESGLPDKPNARVEPDDHSTFESLNLKPSENDGSPQELQEFGRIARERSEIGLLKKDNVALRETIRCLSQHMTSIAPTTITDSVGVGVASVTTAEELITETPLKLKRVLNKLMADSGQKDKEIEKLQVDLSGVMKERDKLSAKNRAISETHRDALESAAAEMQALSESFAQACKHTHELEDSLKTMTQNLITIKRDHEIKVDHFKDEIRALRAEIARFQTNVQVMNHQHFDLHGVVSKYNSEPHIPLEEHKQVVEGLERMLQQMMQNSSTGALQQNIEVKQLRRENQSVAIELSELKGSVSVLKEECRMLRKQKTKYEGIVSVLRKDLKYSQAREMQALECLNESLKDTDKSKTEKDMLSRRNELYAEERDLSLLKTSRRETELQEMVRKMDEYKTKAKLERKATLEKFRSQDKQYHHHQRKSKDRIHDLQTQLQKKDKELEEASRSKRIVERQLDLLWESRTSKH